MLEFLFSPIDPSRLHEVGFALSWHGRFMVFAWGVLVPLGIITARFFKVLPGQDWPREVQNPFWFTWHRVLTSAGLVLMVLGAVLILVSDHDSAGGRLHAWLGWSLAALVGVQLLAVLLKGSGGGPHMQGPGVAGGDHFLMTRTRILFERVHKSTGYLAIVVSVGSITTGMWIANAYVWMWLAQIGIWGGFTIGFVVLQRMGRAIDTYQAIWGTDASFPGNQRPPIGWGIRRGPIVAQDQTVSIKKRRAAARGRPTKPH